MFNSMNSMNQHFEVKKPSPIIPETGKLTLEFMYYILDYPDVHKCRSGGIGMNSLLVLPSCDRVKLTRWCKFDLTGIDIIIINK